MDIIRMTGGLGNQMFQYALFLKLKSLGREVKMDDRTQYGSIASRPILLWCFGIDYPKATEKEIAALTDGSMEFFHRVRRKIRGRKSLEYEEQSCNFDEQLLKREPAYLTGYFQSEKYFKDIEEQVRDALQFSDKIWEGKNTSLLEKIKKYQSRIKSSMAVSVHIRRGDYLDNVEAYGNICTEDYYCKAVDLMQKWYPEAVFYFFSNDSQWVRNWLLEKYGERLSFEVIEGTDESVGYLDMFLMSQCRHHIIANSSFSWWGAWLNPSKEKKVVAPSRWHNCQMQTDIYTQEMIKVSPAGELVCVNSSV